MNMYRIIRPFKEFFQSEQITGFILIFCVGISLLIANSSGAEGYHYLLSYEFGISVGNISFERSLHFWINDALMAVFFLLVGLEIKREVLEGELAGFKKASLPIFAALGGMLVPALFYTLFNKSLDSISGWGIPMATDIAFALGILSLLGKRVPLSIKVFLAALAIADDLGAILVIALFYTEQLQSSYLLYAALIVVTLIALNRTDRKNLLYYLIPGIFLWYFIYRSGIHATISGVLLALCIPTNKSREISPLERLEHSLHKPVAFFIMPIFALSNTDISFSKELFAALSSPVSLGIILGLCVGKPMGILFFSYLAIRLNFSNLPARANWIHVAGVGCLAGIGFTMSIFIALLSFPNAADTQLLAKLSILIASVISAIIGFTILRTRKEVAETDEPIAIKRK